MYLIAVGTTARNYIVFGCGGAGRRRSSLFRWWARARIGAGKDRPRQAAACPLLGEIWLKYQVAQFARILSTLLVGGIPLVQALETAADSLGTPLLQARCRNGRQDGARRPAAFRLAASSPSIFPPLAIDMIEVGESTGALPAMLTSVAEFYEDDVNTRMTATLS